MTAGAGSTSQVPHGYAIDPARIDAAAPSPPSLLYRVVKRLIDLLVALPALLVAAPVMGVIAIVIRRDSPGPALFAQQRVGYRGRLLTFLKFRSMYADSRERFPERFDYNLSPGALATARYKEDHDPRITRVGAVLRRTSLDELPNLVNVVRGDISLVGPRPELPEMVEYYTPTQLAKFAARPGITGLAQTSGRNDLSIGEQIDADVRYVHQRSTALDLRLLLRTVVVVLRRAGAA